jgi:peptidoglycan-N-acetylglucosamine deacetylase
MQDAVFQSRFIRRLSHTAVFLTFDDGPNPQITPRLLDLLKNTGAKATFFLSGESLGCAEGPSIARASAVAGHTIGNHGLLHTAGTYPEFEIMRASIRAATGVDTALFRAPYGRRGQTAAYLERDPTVMAFNWTAHLEDWLPVDLSTAERRIAQIVEPGAIVLLHDGALSCSVYRERYQVLALTAILIAECRRRGIPISGLAEVYPGLHRRDFE